MGDEQEVGAISNGGIVICHFVIFLVHQNPIVWALFIGIDFTSQTPAVHLFIHSQFVQLLNHCRSCRLLLLTTKPK